MLRGDVSVSRLAWDMVRQLHGIEEQHYVLHVPTPDLRHDDHSSIERRVFDELASSGLAHDSTVDSRLLDVMRLLAGPPIELHGWVGRRKRPTVGVVAAGDGRDGVLATLDDRRMRVRSIRPDGLASAVAGLLPKLPPGRGHSVTVPLDVYRDLVERGSDDTSSADLIVSGRRPTRQELDSDAILRILRERRRGGGRVYAASRDSSGRRRKTQYPITYLDTTSGRWLLKHKPSTSGEVWVVVTPATTDLLVAEMSRLLDAVSVTRRWSG